MDIEVILLLHLGATLAMVGLIWFVQVVHYPLFAVVGDAQFAAYEKSHQDRTTMVVAPLMLTEAATASLLTFMQPSTVPVPLVWLGVALVAALWLSTFFWQVPAHAQLAQQFDAAIHRRLVRSNWFRTLLWTLRGVIACAMVA